MNNVEVRALQSNIFQLLAGVPITPSHQLYFNTADERDNYFSGKVIYTFTDMKFMREHRAMKVALNAESLEGANYMRFRNTEYNGVWMYCFIDRIEYVNPNTAYIFFTVDAWQTYFFNVEIRDCDIAREHVPSGSAYNYNTVAEGVDYGDYIINSEREWTYDTQDEAITYVIISTVDLLNSGGTTDNPIIYGANGNLLQGLPSACEVDYLDGSTATLETFFQTISNYPWVAQGIVSIFPFPADFLPKAGTRVSAMGVVIGRAHGNISGGGKRVIEMAWQTMLPAFTEEKLYCYPYSFFEIVTDDSASIIVKPELLSDGNLRLTCVGCAVPTGQILVTVDNYAFKAGNPGRTTADSLFSAVLFSGFPTFPVQNDQYTVAKEQAISTNRLVQQQNSNTLALGAITGGISAIVGGATSWQGGAKENPDQGLLAIPSAIASYAGNMTMSILSDWQNAARSRQKIDMMQGSITLAGNQSTGAQALLMSIGEGLSVRVRAWTVKPEFQEKLQQYFSAFGYASNRIGVPNLNNRPRYNYVKCNSVNIYGNIPNEHLQSIRAMFLNGVTFWHDHDNVGVYGNNG